MMSFGSYSKILLYTIIDLSFLSSLPFLLCTIFILLSTSCIWSSSSSSNKIDLVTSYSPLVWIEFLVTLLVSLIEFF